MNAYEPKHATRRAGLRITANTSAVYEIEYDYLMSDPVKFTAEVRLTKAAPDAGKGQMDDWAVTIASPYGREMSLPYRTGLGHRKNWHHGRMTLYDFERTSPKVPTLEGILASIGSDLMTARDLPATDENALDYLADELGFESPGEALKCLRALRKELDDVRELLRGSGIDPDHFADWCVMLDR